MKNTPKNVETKDHNDIPVTIDGYSIKNVIGEGGMGVVYRAENKLTQHLVALKVVRPELVHELTTRERFKREIDVQSKLSHTNILSIFDYGESDHQLYYVMPLIEGCSLRSLLRELPVLTVPQALSVAVAIASALQVAHDQGFIHRDVNPSNIMLPRVNDEIQFEQALLTDFGVTGILDQKDEYTQIGQVFGTPNWMSPEQVFGRAQNAATDTYGLGLLLYRMIYGSDPYSDDNVAALLYNIANTKIKLPAEPKLAHGLDKFIQACLEKDETKRPVKPHHVLSNIQRLELIGSEAELFSRSSMSQSEQSSPGLDSTRIRFDHTGEFLKVEKYAPASKSSARRLVVIVSIASIVSVLIGIAAVLLYYFAPFQSNVTVDVGPITMDPGNDYAIGDILIGVLLVVGGIFLGFMARSWIRKKQSALEQGTAQLLEGTNNNIDLSRSLAIEVDELIKRCQAVDERFLGKTLAIMIDDFQHADQIADRQKALVSAVDILEKLMKKLSPWYVRKEKLIAFTVSSIGIILGILKIVDSMVK